MRYLILPTRLGVVSLDGDKVATVEPTGAATCAVHMHPVERLGWAERFYHPDGSPASAKPSKAGAVHNTFHVKLPAEVLEKAIAEMGDGDTYDPENLETTGEEDHV